MEDPIDIGLRIYLGVMQDKFVASARVPRVLK